MYHVASESVQLAIPGARRKIDGCADGVEYLVPFPRSKTGAEAMVGILGRQLRANHASLGEGTAPRRSLYEWPKITGQTRSMVFGFASAAWSLGQAQFFFRPSCL